MDTFDERISFDSDCIFNRRRSFITKKKVSVVWTFNKLLGVNRHTTTLNCVSILFTISLQIIMVFDILSQVLYITCFRALSTANVYCLVMLVFCKVIILNLVGLS